MLNQQRYVGQVEESLKFQYPSPFLQTMPSFLQLAATCLMWRWMRWRPEAGW